MRHGSFRLGRHLSLVFHSLFQDLGIMNIKSITIKGLEKLLHILKRLLHAVMEIFFLGAYQPFVFKILIAAGICIIAFTIIERYVPLLEDYGTYILLIYWFLTILEITREQQFAYKWYGTDSPKSIYCPVCHTSVKLRHHQKRELIVTPRLILTGKALLVSFYRPRLHLLCPHCGLDEIVCPYCDKPISEKDKRCPHCGKRVL